MKVKELASYLENKIPSTLSEPWDNDGRMVVPNGDAEVTGVLVALDCTSKAIEKAVERGCNVIVTHHPLVFKPLASLTDTDNVGKRVLNCVQNGIAVLSYHTRLDSMEGGVNDCLADAVGLKETSAFLPYGRIGDVGAQSFEAFAKHVSDVLGADVSMVKANDTVSRVAVVSGAGKDEIADVIAAGADTFVTGEVMHNHMLECKESGLNLICATHYATERVVLPFLRGLIADCGVRAEVLPFEREDEYGI